jgi:hypothetical protein
MEGQGLIPLWAFMLFWIAYGIAGVPLSFGRNVELKRRWFRPYMVAAGFLFLAGMALTGFPLFMVLIAAPFVAGVVTLQLKLYRFCTQCGATAFWSGVPFQRNQFCGRCGAALVDDAGRSLSSRDVGGRR